MEENNKNLTELLASPVPDEVVLANPPLKMVLAQIRFPTMLHVSHPNSPQVVSFQNAIQDDYPHYDEIQQAILQPMSGQVAPQHVRHAFNGNDGWSISLTRDFITLSTTAYKTRKEFVDRIRKLAEAFKSEFQPAKMTRLGIRFVDQVEDQSIINNIGKYVNPQFLGPFPGAFEVFVMQSQLMLPDGVNLNLNWGKFPPNHVLPVDNIPPYSGFSWVLDSDLSGQGRFDFDPNQIAKRADNYSQQIYNLFRHVFNDDFLHTCGGKI